MPDKRDDIDLKDLKVSDNYNKFGLYSNPFPVTGIAAGDPGFAPFDEKITKELNNFIHDTYTRQFFGGFVIIGEYGFGKNYILKHLERRINESLSLRGEDRACFVEGQVRLVREHKARRPWVAARTRASRAAWAETGDRREGRRQAAPGRGAPAGR